MKRPIVLSLMIFAALLMLTVMPADAQRRGETMNLLDAMESGRVRAEFYGNGDQSVRGRISRSPNGPDIVQFQPGTQFQPTTPGRQGMGTLGSVEVDLSRRRLAWVEIPTACTDYDLPAPTPMDRMIPEPPLSVPMARLAGTIGHHWPEREVSQIAVWAVANDPGWEDIEEWVHERTRVSEPEQRERIAADYRDQAARLVWEAGLNPARYRMFQ